MGLWILEYHPSRCHHLHYCDILHWHSCRFSWRFANIISLRTLARAKPLTLTKIASSLCNWTWAVAEAWCWRWELLIDIFYFSLVKLFLFAFTLVKLFHFAFSLVKLLSLLFSKLFYFYYNMHLYNNWFKNEAKENINPILSTRHNFGICTQQRRSII